MRGIQIENNGSRYTIPEPLCGLDWLSEHIRDHTHAEIEALTIEIGYNGISLPPVSAADKRGTVKTIVRGLRC